MKPIKVKVLLTKPVAVFRQSRALDARAGPGDRRLCPGAGICECLPVRLSTFEYLTTAGAAHHIRST